MRGWVGDFSVIKNILTLSCIDTTWKRNSSEHLSTEQIKWVSFTTVTGKGNGNMTKSLIRASDVSHNVCCFQIHRWDSTHWPLAMQACTCLSICKDTSLIPGNRRCYFSLVSLATIWLIRLFSDLTEASPWGSVEVRCVAGADDFGCAFLMIMMWSKLPRLLTLVFPTGKTFLYSLLFSPSRQDY